MLAVIPNINSLRSNWRYVKRAFRVPIYLVRLDGVIYSTGVNYTYTPQPGPLSREGSIRSEGEVSSPTLLPRDMHHQGISTFRGSPINSTSSEGLQSPIATDGSWGASYGQQNNLRNIQQCGEHYSPNSQTPISPTHSIQSVHSQQMGGHTGQILNSHLVGNPDHTHGHTHRIGNPDHAHRHTQQHRNPDHTHRHTQQHRIGNPDHTHGHTQHIQHIGHTQQMEPTHNITDVPLHQRRNGPCPPPLNIHGNPMQPHHLPDHMNHTPTITSPLSSPHNLTSPHHLPGTHPQQSPLDEGNYSYSSSYHGNIHMAHNSSDQTSPHCFPHHHQPWELS